MAVSTISPLWFSDTANASHIVVPRYIWPVPLQLPLAVGGDLHLRDDLHVGAFEAEVEAADAAEQR
jgi:hypothetical protein